MAVCLKPYTLMDLEFFGWTEYKHATNTLHKFIENRFWIDLFLFQCVLFHSPPDIVITWFVTKVFSSDASQ